MGNKRRFIWIDNFQTLLCIRIAVYCVLYQLAVWLVLTLWQHWCAVLETIANHPVSSNNFLPSIVVLLLLAPILTYDAVRFAHRLVGPVFRFRKTIQAIADGEEIELVRLRKKDMLTEMRDDLNRMIKVLEERGAVVLKSQEPKVVADVPEEEQEDTVETASV